MADIDGLAEVEAKLNKEIENIKGDTTEGIQDVALDLLRRSVKLAPVDTGDLRGSGSVDFGNRTIAEGTEDGGIQEKSRIQQPIDNPMATIGFGVPYAARQHEELEYDHPRGGQAKYLEQPMKEQSDNYVKHIRDKAHVDK